MRVRPLVESVVAKGDCGLPSVSRPQSASLSSKLSSASISSSFKASRSPSYFSKPGLLKSSSLELRSRTKMLELSDSTSTNDASGSTHPALLCRILAPGSGIQGRSCPEVAPRVFGPGLVSNRRRKGHRICLCRDSHLRG